VIDEDKDGFLTEKELVNALVVIFVGELEQKIRLTFQM